MMKMTLITLLLFSLSANAADEQQMVDESRQAIKGFATKLKGQLQEGMKQGGPVAAIQICNNVAADIAKQISEQYDWEIGRTSLKVRNPSNSPDKWEKQVLENFEKRLAEGEEPAKLEYHEITRSYGKQYFRYMKAIPTGQVCLSCHGDKIDPGVAGKLDELYPEDLARGFKLGDLRGAFTVKRAID